MRPLRPHTSLRTYWYCDQCGHREKTTRYVAAVTHQHGESAYALQPLTFSEYCQTVAQRETQRRSAQWDAALTALCRAEDAGEG